MQLRLAVKKRHRLRVHRHRVARAWIAPNQCATPPRGENTEATEFHPLAARQSVGDIVEDRQDDQLDIGLARRWGDSLWSIRLSRENLVHRQRVRLP